MDSICMTCNFKKCNINRISSQIEVGFAWTDAGKEALSMVMTTFVS